MLKLHATVDSVMADLAGMLVRPDGFLPKERYTTGAFADLEVERLWSRVWQIACREDELAAPGDFVEYEIGDETIAIVRKADGDVHAFHNACLHRGRRLAEGSGAFAGVRDPVPVPRLVLRARRTSGRRSRSGGLPVAARRPRARVRYGSSHGAASCS